MPNTVHPRADGENFLNHVSLYAPIRSIPVRTGKTWETMSTKSTLPVHPRADGENFFRRSRSVGIYGPSPCGRGKRIAAGIVLWIARSIPVRTGKTQVWAIAE